MFFSPLSQSISKLVKECDFSLKRKKKYFAFINKISYIFTFLYGIDSEKETKKIRNKLLPNRLLTRQFFTIKEQL